MLKFDGIKKNGTMAFLLLSNDGGDKVEIPIELPIADRISKYLGKISKPSAEPIAELDDKDQVAE